MEEVEKRARVLLAPVEGIRGLDAFAWVSTVRTVKVRKADLELAVLAKEVMGMFQNTTPKKQSEWMANKKVDPALKHAVRISQRHGDWKPQFHPVDMQGDEYQDYDWTVSRGVFLGYDPQRDVLAPARALEDGTDGFPWYFTNEFGKAIPERFHGDNGLWNLAKDGKVKSTTWDCKCGKAPVGRAEVSLRPIEEQRQEGRTRVERGTIGRPYFYWDDNTAFNTAYVEALGDRELPEVLPRQALADGHSSQLSEFKFLPQYGKDVLLVTDVSKVYPKICLGASEFPEDLRLWDPFVLRSDLALNEV